MKKHKLKQGMIAILGLLAGSFLKAQELDPQKALSLARVMKNGRTHIIQVSKIDDAYVKGINLSEKFGMYPVRIFDFIEKFGYEQILDKIHSSSKTDVQEFKSEEVLTPVDAIAHTIAAATNYPEHKEETNVKIDPILFPKVTKLTPYISQVKTKKEYLLDYEVELGVVYSRDVKTMADLENQLLGFMVTMDYSDRASQLRDYDTDHPELAVGFTDSKSHEGFFPVGPIMVVPKDWKNYYQELNIKLWRNDELMQDDHLGSMFWDVPKITEEALKLSDEEIWTLNGDAISLLPKKYIEKGTIVVTGTPGGVLLTTPSKGFIIRRAIKYSLLFKFLGWEPEAYVKDQFVKKLHRKDNYLKDGEQIRASISKLGYINSHVVSQNENQ